MPKSKIKKKTIKNFKMGTRGGGLVDIHFKAFRLNYLKNNNDNDNDFFYLRHFAYNKYIFTINYYNSN